MKKKIEIVYQPTLKTLKHIIEHPENYASVDTYLAHIRQTVSLIETHLLTIQKTRYKKDKWFTSNLTEKERWGCVWVSHFIDELLEIER